MQISPDHATNRMFGACLMVVTEPKPWGAQGYVQALGKDEQIGGQAYVRVAFENMEPTGGRAVWIPGSAEV